MKSSHVSFSKDSFPVTILTVSCVSVPYVQTFCDIAASDLPSKSNPAYPVNRWIFRYKSAAEHANTREENLHLLQEQK